VGSTPAGRSAYEDAVFIGKNGCSFVSTTKFPWLLALRSLWGVQVPPPPPVGTFVSRVGGVAVIRQLGAGWMMDVPGGIMKSQNPDHLARAARKMGMRPEIHDEAIHRQIQNDYPRVGRRPI
jgi:hypothetical protein